MPTINHHKEVSMEDRIWIEMTGDWVEVNPVVVPAPSSYSEGPMPARIDVSYYDSGVEALQIGSPQEADALIAALQAARKEVWG